MEKPFLYKYQPLWINDFDLDEDMHLLLKTLLEMDVLNILFIGDSGSGKTSLINAIIHEYYKTIIEEDQPQLSNYSNSNQINLSIMHSNKKYYHIFVHEIKSMEELREEKLENILE